MRLGLILCAFGRHRWYNYCCRSRDADRDTQRTCARCETIQERVDLRGSWKPL